MVLAVGLLASRGVTVAAVILAATAESARADVEGQPRVRRSGDAAWSGGAIPIVVVVPDPEGRVAAALAGAPVTLAEPASFEGGPAAQVARGMDVAAAEVHETEAAIVWPARYVWISPETITSLIEAHGVIANRSLVLRPAFDGTAGWPAVLPVAHRERLDAIAADRMPDDILADLVASGVASGMLDVGDPGAAYDASTPRANLPPYVGPAKPASGHAHEWGAAIADEPDDAPIPGPAIARLSDD